MSVRLVSAATGRPSIFTHALDVPDVDGNARTLCGRKGAGGVWSTVKAEAGSPTCPECRELEADAEALLAGAAA